MNYIYKITNLINNKIYIGQTRSTISNRWNQHVSAAFSNQKKKDYNFLLHKAIRKYGKDNFKIEIIEEVEESQNLDERESFWIHFYNSCILEEESMGYNMTYGGEGSSKINKYQLHELWLLGKGSVEIAKITGYADVSIRKNLESFSDYDKEINFARNTGNTVYCYNENGKLIKEYPSISYAARQVNIDPSSINKCCNKVKNSAGGYFWSYSANENFQPQKLKRRTKYKIAQLSLSGEILHIYDSFSAAGRAMNKKQTKYIKECCDGIRESMYNYKWSYVDKLAQNAADIYKKEKVL